MKIQRINEFHQVISPKLDSKEKRRILKLINDSNILIQGGKNTDPTLDEDYDIEILSNHSVNVFGTVIAKDSTLIPIKFNKISGDFWASEKVKESTNFPNEIGGSFFLHGGNLESLVGGPKSIGDRYDLRNCKNLKSLDGGPESVGENFYCLNCNIESLEGGPSKIGTSNKFFGSDSSSFDYGCSRNNLKTLRGCPEIVSSVFDCSFNNLQNFEYGPKIVHWTYHFVSNDIRDFAGFPSYDTSSIKFISYRCINDSWGVKKNPIEEILNLIPDSPQLTNSFLENATRSKLIFRFIDLINENNVIRNGDTVVADRLIHSLGECGVDITYNNLKLENYEII